MFLFERNPRRFTAKWGAAVRGLAPPAADARPETIEAAVRAALTFTRERAERVRSEARRPTVPAGGAELRFSGIAEPVVDDGTASLEVAPEV